MKRSSVSYLKAHLSAELKAVRAGETVVVMDREHPIAQLVPMSEKRSLEIREPLRPFGFETLAPLISGGSLERLLEDRGRR